MKKILFLAKYGHDLNYFKKITNYINQQNNPQIKCDVVMNIPIFFFELLHLFRSTPLTQDDIEQILEYEIKRKSLKYSGIKLKILLFLLPLTAKLYYIKYSKFIKTGNYTAICIWGGFHVMQKVAILVAKRLNLSVYHFENGLLPNSTCVDLKGTNFYNSVPRDKNFYISIKDPFIKPKFVERGNKLENNEEFSSKKYIFCPFQDWLDSQTLIHSPWIESMDNFYELISELTKDTPSDLYFIIKEHPNCTKSYKHLMDDENSKIIFANNHSTEKLIKNAEAILTINSTVGIESIMMHKKVITLGNAFYSGYGFAKHTNDYDELLEIINNLNNWKVDETLTEQFLSYLQNYYLVSGTWRDCDEEHLKSVYSKLMH